MALFNRYANNCSRVDWAILIQGSISLYYDENILEKDLDWLKNNEYRVINLDFNTIKSTKKFHEIVKKVCEFPDYYGENMSALSDCLMHDLEIPFESGCVLVLKKYNIFYEKEPDFAHDILERLDETSRRRILMGERLIILLQSDNPLFSPNKIGAYNISWNRHEYIEKYRFKE